MNYSIKKCKQGRKLTNGTILIDHSSKRLVMQGLPTHEQFKSQINQTFTVKLDDEKPPEEMTLSEVTELKEIGGGFSAYSMVFTTPVKDYYLNQGQWTLENSELNEVSLFIVPGGPSADIFNYNVSISFKTEN